MSTHESEPLAGFQLDEDERVAFASTFARYDVNNDSALDFDELVSIFKDEKLLKGSATSLAHEVLEDFGSKTISYKLFMQACLDSKGEQVRVRNANIRTLVHKASKLNSKEPSQPQERKELLQLFGLLHCSSPSTPTICGLGPNSSIVYAAEAYSNNPGDSRTYGEFLVDKLCDYLGRMSDKATTEQFLVQCLKASAFQKSGDRGHVFLPGPPLRRPVLHTLLHYHAPSTWERVSDGFGSFWTGFTTAIGLGSDKPHHASSAADTKSVPAVPVTAAPVPCAASKPKSKVTSPPPEFLETIFSCGGLFRDTDEGAPDTYSYGPAPTTTAPTQVTKPATARATLSRRTEHSHPSVVGVHTEYEAARQVSTHTETQHRAARHGGPGVSASSSTGTLAPQGSLTPAPIHAPAPAPKNAVLMHAST